jgi:hypothetical protein
MAPKKNHQGASAMHVETKRVKLNDISIADDSGWRGLSPSHVGTLVQTLKNGDFGNTTLAKPSLLLDTNKKVDRQGFVGAL